MVSPQLTFGNEDVLQHAEYVEIPLDGSVIIDIEPQARSRQSESLAPDGLNDLKASISFMGQLHPIILESKGDRYVLLTGERRLSAMREGALESPEHPNFQKVRAVVVKGPLYEWQKRALQLSENVNRSSLTESELGRALWYQRCALFIAKAQKEGYETSADILAEGNPVEQWKLLMDWRSNEKSLHNVGANWADTVTTLGLSISADRADDIAKAYRDIGDEDSVRLDGIKTSTRARKKVRAAKNEGLESQVDAIIGIVAAFDEADINRSRVLEEAMTILLENPDMPIEQIVSDAVNIVVEGTSGGADDGADDDGDNYDDSFEGEEENEGGGKRKFDPDEFSPFADVKTSKTFKGSQIQRLVALTSECRKVLEEQVLPDLKAALEERVDIKSEDRAALLEEMKRLDEVVEDSSSNVMKFGIVEG